MSANERTIVLGKYKGITVKKQNVEVTDAEVESYFTLHRQDYAARVDITDRGIEQGDIVFLDYVCYLNDRALEGASVTDLELLIGTDSHFKGFDEQLEAAETGDRIGVYITMPDDYDKPRLRGKEVLFKCQIKKIQKLVFEDTDDEIRAKIREELLAEKKEKAESELEDLLINELIETSEIEIFDDEMEAELDVQFREWAENMKAQGFLPEKYLKVIGSDEEKQKILLRKDARIRLSTRIVLDAIADAEGYEPSDAEIDNQIAMIAEHLGMPAEVLKSRFDEHAFASVREDVRVFRAMEIVKENVIFE